MAKTTTKTITNEDTVEDTGACVITQDEKGAEYNNGDKIVPAN